MSIKNDIIKSYGSIEKAADKLKISRQHLNDICIGRVNPSRKLAIKIEKIAGIPIAIFGYVVAIPSEVRSISTGVGTESKHTL